MGTKTKPSARAEAAEAEKIAANPGKPFIRFLQLLLSPISGWKRLKNAGYLPDYFARALFYPLLALLAASHFMLLIYAPGITVTSILQEAVASFVAGFAGYFCVMLLARTFLPVEAAAKMETAFGRVYVMAALCILSLGATVYFLVPWIGLFVFVVPIYTAYILVKGIRFLRIPESEHMPTATVMILLVILIPALIYFLLQLLMPSAPTAPTA